MSKNRVPQATQLVDLALRADSQLFHTPEGIAYAAVLSRGHRETWPIRSGPFKLWLASAYYGTTKGSPNAQAMSDAVGVLEAQARFDGATETVFTRIAERDGAIYLDLADDAWRVAKITKDGWSVLDSAPVRFRRPHGMQPLPLPERGGRLDALRELVNLDDGSWTLVVAWEVGTLRPDRPFPVLAIAGEHGTAKTTTVKMLRRLVDPNVADLRAFPRHEDDLVIAANNGWIIGFDNVSFLPDWLSDGLCRLSTGAGFGKRQHYTDADEVLFHVKRPVMLNDIPEVTTKGDLADRALSVVLARIAAYREERELWDAYVAARPRLLGALLDVVAGALREFPRVRLETLPRMADFARWATAAEPALGWKPGQFATAYRRNRETAHHATLEASAVGQAVLTFMSGRAEWTGNAKSLLHELDEITDEEIRRDKGWPKGDGGPRALGGKLRTIAPNLRAMGIEVEFQEGGGTSKRIWTLRSRPQDGQSDGRDGGGTVHDPRESAAHPGGCSGRDGRDGPSHYPSAEVIPELFPGSQIVRGRRP